VLMWYKKWKKKIKNVLKLIFVFVEVKIREKEGKNEFQTGHKFDIKFVYYGWTV
jgi:hypothetical protein